MSLRLRLTFFYVLFLGLVMAALAFALHLGVRASLYRALDASLQDALALAQGLINQEDHTAHLGEGEAGGWPPDLALFLFQEGRLVDRKGVNLPPPPAQAGCWSRGEVRYCGIRLEQGFLVAARSAEWVEVASDRLDRLLEVALPLALLLSFGAGYWLAGQALAPLDALTLKALELSERPDPKARLPEPRSRDELHRLARAQNRLLSALEAHLEKERRFLQNAAHELRTPLAALVGRLEQALEQDPPARRPLERAREASIDLWRLVERLLLLARAERMGAKEPVDFGAVVLEALEEVETRGKALELDLPHAPCPLKGDPILLKAAVRNLLDNAFKFARSRVRVGLRCQKGILLEVADDGPGVPPGEEERIFEAFHQASPAHRSQGSGLGLALVRRVAELHGGRAVYKRRGEGALFLLELPGEASGAWP